jgi:diguanylate cyclase (GGDEF)-like protein
MTKSEKKAEKDWSAVEVMQEVNEKLSSYVEDLEQRNLELERLRGLGTLLQSCLTIEETHAVIARTVPKLFFTESGAVYLLSAPLQTLAPVAAWGVHTPVDNFSPQIAGWSLVQERSYSGDGRCFPVLYPDGEQAGQDTCFCAPIVGQRETLGLLYVHLNGNLPEQYGDNHQRVIKYKRQLAVTTAETIALFLTNIKMRENLYHQSIHDPLTGLLNRRPMYEFLEKELLRTTRKKQPLGLIMIDIDHFKTVNDTYGHEAGDAVLREFGMFVQKHIRAGDFACRYGGEEFLLVMTECSLENVEQRAEQFLKEARLMGFHYCGRVLDPITLSLGVAVYPEHGQTAQELLLAADAALYQAKSDGRDRIATVRQHTIAEPAQQLSAFRELFVKRQDPSQSTQRSQR